ncbi:MAG: hypothetical protein ACJATI_004799, partial [Halioglobus sp.]
MDDAPVYQLPKYTYYIDAESIDLKPILKKLDSEILYTFFIKGKSKFGFDHFIKNNGYSKGLLFQNLLRSGDDCEGIVEFSTFFDDNGNEYLYAFVVGCDQIYSAFNIDGYWPSNTIPYDASNSYSANITCQNDSTFCVYNGIYGTGECILGETCDNNGCPGTITYGCECIENCIHVPIRDSYNENGQLVLTVMFQPDAPNGLPADCFGEGGLGEDPTADNPNIQWSNGETSLSITVSNPDARYSVEVICADGCTYCGTYNSRAGCAPGGPCWDGDSCTINDRLDDNCNCIGEPVDNCDINNPGGTGGCGGTLTINQVTDPSGGVLLVPVVPLASDGTYCDPIQYIWNGDVEIGSSYFYSPSGGGEFTLVVICEECSYEATVDLNTCTPGEPCDDDNMPSTIEVYNELCECISYPCPDLDNDGVPDDCDVNQPCGGNIKLIHNVADQIISVDVTEVECPEGVSYLWSNGATTASIPYVNESISYSVTVTCLTGCQYITLSGESDDDCILGGLCPGTSCFGLAYYDQNCNCIDVDPEYSFTTNFAVTGGDYSSGTGQVTVTMTVDEGICDGEEPDFLWNTGQEDSSIVITNLEATYVVTVTCADGCDFSAYYNLNAQDCVIGAPCVDGDDCTVWDTYDSECNCVGMVIGTVDCDDGPCIPGTQCDDGDPCTYFDVSYGDFCCIGFHLLDEFDNVIIDCSDDPCIIGALCNDGDPCTTGDEYNDICECEGIPIYPPTNCIEVKCQQEAEINVSSTSVYNEVSLTASIPVCEYDISYEWSDGSTTQNIV